MTTIDGIIRTNRPTFPSQLSKQPPAITHAQPLDELRERQLRPFAIWAHDGAGYLGIPTIWAVNGPAAIRQLVRQRDRDAKLTDRHGRRPSRITRELRVVWSSGMETGLLRADLLPWPTARAVDDQRAPLPIVRPGSLAAAVDFAVTLPVPGCGHVECAINIPKDVADYRTGRAIVYQLAAKVEMLGLRPTWAMDVSVRLADGAQAAAGRRGSVTLCVHGDGDDAARARHHMRVAIDALRPEIKAEC